MEEKKTNDGFSKQEKENLVPDPDQITIERTKLMRQVQLLLKTLWPWVKPHLAMANSHGADFISSSHWDTYVPASAQGQLLALSRDQLVDLPLNCPHDPPTAVTVGSQLENTFQTDTNIEYSSESVQQIKVTATSESSEDWLDNFLRQARSFQLQNLNIPVLNDADCFHGNLSSDVISDAMSEKKIHEVKIMSNKVKFLYDASTTDVVVDLGSGKGYLSTELSRQHHIPVLGLDSCDQNTHGAKSRDARLGKRWQGLSRRQQKNNTKQEQESLSHSESPSNNLYVPVTKFVEPDMDLRSLLLTQAAHLCAGKDPSAVKLLLTGLHCCGSLSVTGLQLFLKDPAVSSLCIVGCCYQLMDELQDSSDLKDNSCHFPLSTFGQELGLRLGRNARNLASQSVHRIQASKQLQGEDFYWRALLDVLLRDLIVPVPDKINGMRGLNKRSASFFDYAMGAFKKLGLPTDQISPERISSLEKQYEDCQHQLACFFQLKLALAPAIEALVLLDRWLYLLEQDSVVSASLVQLFDPQTSPRCFALVAQKQCQERSTAGPL